MLPLPQAKTDDSVKTATSKILREAEESRRELDLQLHNENLKVQGFRVWGLGFGVNRDSSG